MIFHGLIAMVAGWSQRHEPQVITYFLEEHRVLKAQLGGYRLHLTDTERRRLVALPHSLGRKRLQEVATLVTPETLLRWYTRLTTRKFDGSRHRQKRGRPCVAEEIEPLVVRMAEENPSGLGQISRAPWWVAALLLAQRSVTWRNFSTRQHLQRGCYGTHDTQHLR